MVWACYLYFTPESEGTLFSKWSESTIETALASFQPAEGTKIPGYLTENDGKRTEICRNISASRVQNYYRGYCEFIKQAFKYNGIVVNHQTDGGSKIFTLLAYLTPNDEIYFPNNEEEVLVKDYIAVSVLNVDNNIFKGVKTTTKGQFVDKSTQSGYYAIRFDR